jgi:NAD(P)-dependent dehydrogenase (short-subunit alcohol dehydrogenase family)
LNSVEKIVDCPVPLFSFQHSSSASYEENRGQFEAALEDVLESAARSADLLSETVKLAEGRVIAVPADVSDRALVRSVEFMLGPVNLLVNHAATGGPFRPFWESNPEDWWRCHARK